MLTRTLPFKKFLDMEFPLGFQSQLPLALETAYSEAFEVGRVSGLSEGGVTKLLPPLESERLSDAQGLFAQNAVHNLASRFPSLKANFGSNSKRRQHVQVRSENTLLTVHRVYAPESMPKNAVYRKTNAVQNIRFFSFVSDFFDQDENMTYMYLLHGASIQDKSQLGFVTIAIPDHENKRCLVSKTIFMHSDYSVTSEAIEIESTAMITLKIGAKKKKITSL
jgi:hypothetical protein